MMLNKLEENTRRSKERKNYKLNSLKEIKNSYFGNGNKFPRFVIQIIPEVSQHIDFQNEEHKNVIANEFRPYLSDESTKFDITAFIESVIVENDTGYARIYNDGKLEIVCTSYSDENNKTIPYEYEKDVEEAFKSGLKLLESLGVKPSLYGYFSILGAKGYKIIQKNEFSTTTSPKEISTENDDLIGGEFIIVDYNIASERIAFYLRGTLNNILRAAGVKPISINEL